MLHQNFDRHDKLLCYVLLLLDSFFLWNERHLNFYRRSQHVEVNIVEVFHYRRIVELIINISLVGAASLILIGCGNFLTLNWFFNSISSPLLVSIFIVHKKGFRTDGDVSSFVFYISCCTTNYTYSHFFWTNFFKTALS